MGTNKANETATVAAPVAENTQQDELGLVDKLAVALIDMKALQVALAAKETELADKEKELVRVKKLAEANAKPTKAAAAAPANQAARDPNRRVKIKLFKDGNRYKEPLYVRVNGYTALIPRGVEVSVPYFVAKHIEEMTQQDENTAALVESYAQEYNQKFGPQA